MGGFFKTIAKGIGYFFLFPLLVIAITLYAVFGVFVFIFQFGKLIFLFFSGRNLFSELPEDVQVRTIIEANKPSEEEKEEVDPHDTFVSPVYGSGYIYPVEEKHDEEDISEVDQDIVDVEQEENDDE